MDINVVGFHKGMSFGDKRTKIIIMADPRESGQEGRPFLYFPPPYLPSRPFISPFHLRAQIFFFPPSQFLHSFSPLSLLLPLFFLLLPLTPSLLPCRPPQLRAVAVPLFREGGRGGGNLRLSKIATLCHSTNRLVVFLSFSLLMGHTLVIYFGFVFVFGGSPLMGHQHSPNLTGSTTDIYYHVQCQINSFLDELTESLLFFYAGNETMQDRKVGQGSCPEMTRNIPWCTGILVTRNLTTCN